MSFKFSTSRKTYPDLQRRPCSLKHSGHSVWIPRRWAKMGSGKRCSCGLPGTVSAGGLSSPLPLSWKTHVCQSRPPSTSSPWTPPPVPPAHRRCVSVLWRSRSRGCRLAMTPARRHFSAFCLQLDAAGTKGRRWEPSLWMHQNKWRTTIHAWRENSADILLATTMYKQYSTQFMFISEEGSDETPLGFVFENEK